MKTGKIKFNWPLVGNQHIVGYLSKIIAKVRMENASAGGSYIFYGPNNLGKTTVANYFANSLVCQAKIGNQEITLPCGVCATCRQIKNGIYSDIYLTKREEDKKEISIEQIKELIHSLGMSSFFDSYKIGIIKNAETLSEKAANALLKTLEEPRKKVLVILITANLDALPATIVSRSQCLEFKPVPANTIYDYLLEQCGAKRSEAKNYSHLCSGKPALAVKFLQDKDFLQAYQERAMAFLGFPKQDVNARIFALDNLLGVKPAGQAAVRISAKIIESWQSLIRDLLLLHANQEDLIQHQIYLPELQELREKLPVSSLLSLFKISQQARVYLEANVNPKVVLENVVLSI
jgi:DNA polymerase III gamma/tau subunit